MSLSAALTDLQSKVGTETHVSDWLIVSQEMINQFAEATLDRQWIHVDLERAANESPHGTTIGHGYLTLSLISHLASNVDPERPRYGGMKMAINYGLNRVRFPHPVPAGSRIRARVTLQGADEVKDNGIQVVNQVTVELENAEKPACVAETLARLYFES
ncbi:MAG: MaoC family dehydratase [Chloroflexota bacterium]